MRFHDFKLQGYLVEDKGKTISLNLIYDYPDVEKELSCIKFSEVTLYDFKHTAGSIILDIEEFDIASLVEKRWKEFQYWNKWYSVSHWDDDPDNFIENLKSKEYKVWEITSAIGFYGFVVAKNISNT